MEKFFEINGSTALAILISTLGISIAVIILTRLAGKRSFSKMSSFDFATTVAIGSIIASTLLSSSVTLPEGIVGLASIYLFQLLVAKLRLWKPFRDAVDNEPLLLMEGTNILHDNLKKADVTVGDLRSKLREANVIRLEQVKAVIFETTGDISVLHTSGEDDTELEDWLLEGVQRS